MALTIGQIAAASYQEVLTEARPANQWAESVLYEKLESMGMIKHRSFGQTLEETLDYNINPSTDFLMSSLQPTSLTETEILTAASYSIAELSISVVWSKKTEVQNPTKNQKVDIVDALLKNGFTSHDNFIEQKIFATSVYNGFNPMNVLCPTSGQGNPGGIDASVETPWRNAFGNYLPDGSDIEAQFTTVYNTCAKGSGTELAPKLMFSGSTPHALFESTQVPFQRWTNTQDLKAGFKTLAFKTCIYIFSQYGGTKVYFSGPGSLALQVSKEYFRDKGETQEIDNANGFGFKIYTACQLTTNNKSRLGVLETL